jgi:hypothetical protein
MSSFGPAQDRTRVFGKAYVLYAAIENPRKNVEQGKKGHLWLDTN